ncbi:hypothetical protein [Magnetospirillum moscoviense]|uniref:hypothetical protein n=1 Tax=Magnetospirillum moscoviense TaxID=1437059 RepID=UPI000A5FE606|nr:hypothetical protein [Magnetospirillum moscoviense]MBF0323550.1 hypothetical protein [Alphaproteobacteria bacterium]
MDSRQQWIELAHILEAEWRGERINRSQARDLAMTLLPKHPEMRMTLSSIQTRMARA